jgi:hypothetical protein
MGKRSKFQRREDDFYPTPRKAVLPLIPYLGAIRTFAEPCCGDGDLIRHLESFDLRCVWQGDIRTGQNAFDFDHYGGADAIITNPPFLRSVLNRMIPHFSRIAPTWTLLAIDWASTYDAAPILPSCSDIIPIGRVKWIEDTEHASMENFGWLRFDVNHVSGPVFHRRGQVTANSSSRNCSRCGRAYVPQRTSSLTCSNACRQARYRDRLNVTPVQRVSS